jgi:hypothetical protein
LIEHLQEAIRPFGQMATPFLLLKVLAQPLLKFLAVIFRVLVHHLRYLLVGALRRLIPLVLKPLLPENLLLPNPWRLNPWPLNP